ncbi:hypothetical protein E4U21_000308 [Claviceps maximensis]|nr:hypothetical protein E4U21_000308 [Claviceps maximensis]
MRTILLPLLVFASSSEAVISLIEVQQLLPACSLTCLAEQVLAHGCGLEDLLCQCQRIEPIIRTVSPLIAHTTLPAIATGKAIYKVCKTVPDNDTDAQSIGSTTPIATPSTTPSATPSATSSAETSKTAARTWGMGVVAVAVMAVCW